MYLFFLGYEGGGLPSFQKFAKSVGLTVSDIEGFRSHKIFNQAWEECLEIRRDILIDRGLERKFDPSFTKFLITREDEIKSKRDVRDFVFELEVKE